MNFKKIFPLLIVLIFVGGYFIGKSAKKNDGEIAPSISTSLLNGDDFELESLRGQYVLLDFWGSWCGPCRKHNPTVVDLYNQYSKAQFKDADGFTVVNVAIEKDKNRTARAIEKDGLIWPYHIVQESRFVAVDPIARAYKVTDLPTYFFIGPDGKIIGRNMDMSAIKETLEKNKV